MSERTLEEVFGPEIIEQAPFRVIYADPPWETPNRLATKSNPSSTHYPLMRNEDIANMPVADIAARDAILVLWVTWPNMAWMSTVVRNWGFRYISGMPWLKVTKDGRPWIALGRWFRECSELVVVGKRGKPPVPPLGSARNGIILAPRGKESRKPEEVAQWIESVSPGPYLEMFARRPRPGWSVWGLEADGSRYDGQGNMISGPTPLEEPSAEDGAEVVAGYEEAAEARWRQGE